MAPIAKVHPGRPGPERQRRRSPAARGALALAVAGAWLPALEAPGSPWEARPPELRAHPGFSRLESEVEEARVRALEDLAERLGVAPGPHRIRWILAGGAAGRSSGPSTFEAGSTRLEPGEVQVRLPAHRYLRRPAKARAVVRHEAVHAVLASRLAPERYRRLPVWFREGLALWFSGEGPLRLEAAVARDLFAGRAAGAFAAGAPEAPGPEAAVLEAARGYLTIRWLVDARGEPGLRGVTARVLGGASPAAAAAAVQGLAPGAFSAGARRAAERAAREWAGAAGAERVARALDLVREGRSEEALAILGPLAAAPGEPGLRATARYALARALHAAGRRREAGRVLEGLLEAPLEVPWEAEALELLGVLRLELGAPAAARDSWREALERFPEDGALVERIGRRLAEAAGR